MAQPPTDVSISVRDLVRFLLVGAVPALLVAAAAAAAMFLWAQQQPPVFRADATVLVARNTAGLTQFGLASVTAQPIGLGAYLVAASSDVVLGDALRRMGVEEPTIAQVRSLRAQVTSSEASARDASLLRVEGAAGSAERAVERANAVADALAAWDERRSSDSINRVVVTLERQIEALTEQIRTLQAVNGGGDGQLEGLLRLRAEQQQQLGYARALVASAQGSLTVLQVADTTVRQVAPRPVMNALLAGFLAVVAVYALLLLRTALNTRLRGADDIAAATGLQVLAEFPVSGRNRDPRLVEAANYLRAGLLFNSVDAQPRVFVVTSAGVADGKSTVSCELAESFARYGYRTILVDADLRSPSIIERFEVVGTIGRDMTTEAWLVDPGSNRRFLSVPLGDGDTLDVIPQIQPVENAAELLGRGFREVLRVLEGYDVVVIDTPPLLAVSDALSVAAHSTGTVLVADPQRSDRRKLSASVEALQRIGVHVVGVVANRVATSGGSGTYGGEYARRAARPRQAKTVDEPALARAGGRRNG